MAIIVSRRIRSIYPDLSKGQKRIANIVLREPHRAKDYSSLRLANAAEVSESTVFRFIKVVGYDSYSEFKQAIATEIQYEMRDPDKIVLQTEGVMCANLINKTLNMDVENIKHTIACLDTKLMSDLVDNSIKSKRKFIIAFGKDALPAKMLYENYVTLFDDVTFLTSADDCFAHLLSLNTRDQVVFFSISDKSPALQGLIRFAKSQKSNTVLITDNSASPLSGFADSVIIARAETPSYAESFSAAFSIVDALTLEIVRKDRIRVTARYKQIRKLKTEFAK